MTMIHTKNTPSGIQIANSPLNASGPVLKKIIRPPGADSVVTQRLR
jgi:hypothetical protein